jgi:hypothetical protein
MVYNLSYRRPQRQPRSSSESVTGEHKQLSIHESVRSGSSGMSHGIPEALSFDRIIAGGVCPPCTVRDFMNFLKYIELSAENLQFFLWYRDYSKRFNALPESERMLSPEWNGDRSNGEAKPKSSSNKAHAEATAFLTGTDFASEKTVKHSEKSSNPFFTPPHTPTSDSPHRDESFDSYDESMTTGRVNHYERAAGAFGNAGLKWKPCELN